VEAVTLKTAYIQKATPAKRSSRAGDFASDLAALGLHSGEHGFNGGWDGYAERFAGATLRAGERKDAILEIHIFQRDLCLTQAAASSQGDLKADSHPFGYTFHGNSLPYDFNLIIRKHRFDAIDRPPLNSVIQQGDRVHLSEESSLAMNPLEDLQILAGLVPSSLTAGRAGEALTPLQINFAVISGKRLQGYFFFDNETRKMTPAIPVIHFCQRGNGMILDQIINPIVAVIRSLFVHSNSGGLGRCLRAMQRVVDSVAGAFCTPLASWIFEPNKEPRTPLFNVGISQGDNGNIRLV
jgi:hypothetical protein